MLVLTRKVNQSIMIGDDIEIIVVDIKPGNVKLGIKAPKNVPVHRSEVYEEIRRENIAAASQSIEKLSDLSNILKTLKKPDKKKDSKNKKEKK